MSIFEQRETLPDRVKLAKNISKSVKRALKQLTIGARKLRENIQIYDQNGDEVELERSRSPQGIVLVPEIGLLTDENHYWLGQVANFMHETRGFLHILDTTQLFRVMQAAHMIAEASERSTPMMAFEYYLIERAKAVVESRSIGLDMILRLQT